LPRRISSDLDFPKKLSHQIGERRVVVDKKCDNTGMPPKGLVGIGHGGGTIESF
jgi:hypothetical protein